MIETERLILRNYKIEDLNDYYEYVSQKNVGPRCGWPPYTDIEKAKERLEVEVKKPLQFAIVLKAENKVIGSIELMEPDENTKNQNNSKEIGCLLNENYWSGGLMTEALKVIVKYGIEHIGLDEIVAGYFEPNVGSGKALLKAGLKPFKRIENYTKWYETNEDCDAIITKITKQEYDLNPIYRNWNITFLEEEESNESYRSK